MRIPRIYTSEDLRSNQIILIESQAHKHIKDVLRLKLGDSLILFNGNGYDYAGKITESKKKTLSIQLEHHIKVDNESPLKIHLLQPLCRSEKMDWCLQKATELGASKITPFISSRVNIRIPTNRLNKKLEHWDSVIQSACEQSGRATIPTLAKPLDFNTAISNLPNDSLKVIASPVAENNEIENISFTPRECICLVGPEGGFTKQETLSANNTGFYNCLLGPRVLRLETAVIAVVTLLQAKWGDLN